MTYQIHICIAECLGLSSADSNGFSDPYIKIKLNDHSKNKKYKTKIIKKQLDPVWYEEFSYVVDDLESNKLILQVYDHDKIGSDDFLGRVEIPLTILNNNEKLDEYFPLMDANNFEKTQGVLRCQLLVDKSVLRFDDDHQFEVYRRELFQAAFQPNYMTRTSLKVFLGSWNVGNALPKEEELKYWLDTNDLYDIIAIGAQECEWGDNTDVVHNSGNEWFRLIMQVFGDRYSSIKTKSLMQMRLIVLVKKELYPILRNIQSDTEATGIAGIVGNKGGVCVSFAIYDTRYCFINSHLAAHQHLVERRNDNFREIVNGISVGYPGVDILNQFHYICWLGDLNYRLNWGDNTKIPKLSEFASVLDLIEKKEFVKLHNNCQLSEAIVTGKAFYGFEDILPVLIQPTFKVKRKRRDIEYNAERLPAWCDRILIKTFDHFEAKHSLLESSLDVTTSDHKPVRASAEFSFLKMPIAYDRMLGTCILKISGLRAIEDVPIGDMNGSSDPYLYITSPISTPVQTSIKKKTLRPDWSNEDIMIIFNVNNPHRLKYCFLNILMYDHDLARPDDILCQTRLDLYKYFDNNDGPFRFPYGYKLEDTFKLELESGGVNCSVLEVEATLTWEKLDV